MPSLAWSCPSSPLKATIYRFTEATCAVVEELRPEVVSFHFGLPAPELVQRVKRAGCKVICSATTRREALWLAERGVDAIIAQGAEAGGHRGMFIETEVATQIGTFALVQQIVEAVKLPVIAAGGIGDAKRYRRGVCSRRCRRADRHRLSALPRGHHLGLAQAGARRARPRDGDRRHVERAAGPRHPQSLHQRAGADQSGPPGLSLRHTRARAAAQGGRSERIGRFLLVLVGAGGGAPFGHRRRRADAEARRGG